MTGPIEEAAVSMLHDGRRGLGIALAALAVVGCPTWRVAGPVGPPPTPAAVSRPVGHSGAEPILRGAFREDWQAREDELRGRLLANPDDTAAWVALGEVYRRQRLYSASLQAYEEAERRAPRDASILAGKAEVLLERGSSTEALAAADAALRCDPRCGAAHAVRGQVLELRHENAAAVEAYEAGWAARPPSVTAGLALARWDLRRGEPEPAADRLRLCVAYQPDDASARQAYAEALTRLGRLPDARDQWRWLVDRGHGGALAYYRLAEIAHRAGDGRGANEYLARAEHLDPERSHPASDSVRTLLAERPRLGVPEPLPSERR